MTNIVEFLMDELVYNAKLKERNIDQAKLSVELASSYRLGGRRQQAAQCLHLAAHARKQAEKHGAAMTERELFRRFYRAARLDAQAGIADIELRHIITEDAVNSGFSPATVLQIRAAALNASINAMLPVREPSKQSVAIQTMVFTFGRVTKGVSA
ncbi:hypothetical protein [Oceanimonas baumannii]|uniref:Uncharacterized protein n=2 Tax=Oceanimonas baumannii TaxID=129578 RepID=A0ABY2EZR4_9GAMM|nr:hypothetical protein [Oceanimonas baumannii]TDW59462.1 hypothetical protein LY04_01713 [Oceanimonas baumannii]